MRKLKNWIVKYVLREWPRRKIESVILNALGEHTCLGIFSGMRYISLSIGSEYYPKLLGTYEQELTSIFTRFFYQDFDQFIDIGAAEGYYAVGVALKTNWKVIAFEANPETPLKELAKLNGVEDRVTLKGACDLGDLTDQLESHSKSFLLVDVETAELSLLDPRFIPSLESATMVVEVHDCFIPGIGDRLVKRFKSTHDIQRIDCLNRTFSDFPISLPKLPFDPTLYVLPYLDERRPEGMYWLILTPKQG